MRRSAFWIPIAVLAVLGLAVWGVWTWQLTAAQRSTAFALEAERQKNFSDMAHHVEQIQALMGKGLVTGNTRQNMRYMSDVHHHAMSATTNMSGLPLPAEISRSTGKFLKQTGDFASSLLRNEAAGREMDGQTQTELARLRSEAVALSAQLQSLTAEYHRGSFQWNPPLRFSLAGLFRRGAGQEAKPPTGAQAPTSMVGGSWTQIRATLDKLPVMIYDGPFADNVAQRAPATSGPPVDRNEAAQRVANYLAGGASFRTVGVTEVAGNLPTYSFQLAPTGADAGGPYTTVMEVARNGGHLVQFLNSRTVGKPAIDLARARTLGLEYLTRIGFRNLVPTYGQIMDGEATIAYAVREQGVIIYPDQVKVKVALDNGEVLAVDARQYLMSHHPRRFEQPTLSALEAQERLNGSLQVQRVQMALIPNIAGTGEILTYEFLTRHGEETFLVYVNANTGFEEQVLQQVDSDGGTFTL